MASIIENAKNAYKTVASYGETAQILAAYPISYFGRQAVVVAIADSARRGLNAFKFTRDKVPSALYSSTSRFLEVVAAASIAGDLVISSLVSMLGRDVDPMSDKAVRFLTSGLIAAAADKFVFKEALQPKKIVFVALLVTMARYALDVIESSQNSTLKEHLAYQQTRITGLNSTIETLNQDQAELKRTEAAFNTLMQGGSVEWTPKAVGDEKPSPLHIKATVTGVSSSGGRSNSVSLGTNLEL